MPPILRRAATRLAAALFALPFLAFAATAPAPAQEHEVLELEVIIARISAHIGEMSMHLPARPADQQVRERLRFEPWQMLDDLYRDDIVLLMRQGPTDWSFRDAPDAAPEACDAQRAMTDAGKAQMRDLGALLVANELMPSRIVASEWCRSRQTADALAEGMARVRRAGAEPIETRTDPSLNPLLSAHGPQDVAALRARIAAWDGGDGPLLLITHFANIRELTAFWVYEGEMLILDPKRDNRVLGYLRLGSAEPDIGHFDASVVRDR